MRRTLKKAPYHRRIRLVTVSGASNVTGWINNIDKLAALAHGYDIPILVDGAQLAAHRRINSSPPLTTLAAWTLLAVSGHKLYAPFGTGVLIGPREVFERGSPEIVGGGTVDLVTPWGVEWTEPPAREEAGSPNLIGVIALATALDVLAELGMDNIAAHEQSLTDYAAAKLVEIPGLKIYGSTKRRDRRRLGVMSFSLEGYEHGAGGSTFGLFWGYRSAQRLLLRQPYIQRLLGLDGKDSKTAAQPCCGKNQAAAGSSAHQLWLIQQPPGNRPVGRNLETPVLRPSEYWLQHLPWNPELKCYIPAHLVSHLHRISLS